MSTEQTILKQNNPFKVLILMETSEKSQREWLRGILSYAKWNGPWEIYLKTGYANQAEMILEPGNLNYDGLIGSAVSKTYCDIILQSKIPTLVIEPFELIHDFPVEHFHVLKSDTRAAGQKGAEYLLARNWNHYAYLHDGNLQEWSLIRGEGFAEKIEEEGFRCFVFKEKFCHGYTAKMTEWLVSLPKPVALMAANDFHGRLVIECCRLAGIRVPEEIAVLGVDNDEIYCEATYPTLTSLTMTGEAAGYEGGALLDQMMRGKKFDNTVFIISKPGEIAERESTAFHFNADPIVSAAMEYIHLNLDVNFTTEDIAESLDISRRTLEQKFRKVKNTTIRQEIVRMRLEKAKFLLRETDYTLSKIALLSGFSNVSYLALVFRKMFNQTLMEYRNAEKK